MRLKVGEPCLRRLWPERSAGCARSSASRESTRRSRNGATRRASRRPAPGDGCDARSACRSSRTSLRGGRASRTSKTSGLAKTDADRVDWSGHRDRPALLRVVRAGDWPSGLYFVRATARDGRVGYAPFIVRPRRLGTTASRSCCRRTRGPHTTSPTRTATAGATPGTSPRSIGASTPSVRSSTSVSRSGSTTGTSIHRMAEPDRAARSTSSRTTTSTRSRAATSSRGATTSSCSPATRST